MTKIGKRGHLLMPKEIRNKIPQLQNAAKDSTVWVKFFSPYSGWTWYATEFDGVDTFFGYVTGFANEWGYFSLKELEETTLGPDLPAIERDCSFTPQPLINLLEKAEITYGTRG